MQLAYHFFDILLTLCHNEFSCEYFIYLSGLFFGAQSNLSRAVNESIYNLNSRISSDFSLLAYTKQTNISSSLKLKSDGRYEISGRIVGIVQFLTISSSAKGV